VLYLARHLRLHLRRPGQWDLDEIRLRQGVLIDLPPADFHAVDGADASKPDHVGDPDEMVQTPAPVATGSVSPETSSEDDPATEASAADLIAAARAKQAWEAMMRNRRGGRRG
jgi:hypothetical protein